MRGRLDGFGAFLTICALAGAAAWGLAGRVDPQSAGTAAAWFHSIDGWLRAAPPVLRAPFGRIAVLRPHDKGERRFSAEVFRGPGIWSLKGAPDWVAMDSKSGTLSWTDAPETPEPKDVSFEVEIADARGKRAAAKIEIVLSNHSPSVSFAPAALEVGAPWEGRAAAVDPDGDVMEFFVADGALPDGLELDSSQGRVHGTPSAAGSFSFSLGVRDGKGGEGKAAAVLVVPGPEATAFLEPEGNPSGRPNGPFELRMKAQGKSVRFSFPNLPAWVSADASGRVFGNLPADPSGGEWSFSAEAEGAGGKAVRTFSLKSVNAPPSPARLDAVGTLWAGRRVDASISSGDPDGDPVSCALDGTLPEGLSLDSSCRISGVPLSAGTFRIAVAATDSYGATTRSEGILSVEEPRMTAWMAREGRMLLTDGTSLAFAGESARVGGIAYRKGTCGAEGACSCPAGHHPAGGSLRGTADLLCEEDAACPTDGAPCPTGAVLCQDGGRGVLRDGRILVGGGCRNGGAAGAPLGWEPRCAHGRKSAVTTRSSVPWIPIEDGCGFGLDPATGIPGMACGRAEGFLLTTERCE